MILPVTSVAGAPEAILALCTEIRPDGKNHPPSKSEKEELEATYVRMSEEGLRVLAVAVRHDAPKQLKTESIPSLSFVGFLGMQDTLRPEVKEAMQRAKEAGGRGGRVPGGPKIT